MKEVKGNFITFEGERFYKIENYDMMDDFFMTITSSSDIWNFCWSLGGITAGRIDCDHAIFPYYTADKVSDFKNVTGPYTSIKINKNGNTVLWEPFADLNSSAAIRFSSDNKLFRNIYKNVTGTKIWFEEINTDLNISFMQGWTSSAKYGLVRTVKIRNLGEKAINLEILDGCRNIMPACCTADFQNVKSNLLDAYKKTDFDAESNLALFTVSSVVSDKAEPNEGLYANVSWFSAEEELVLDTDAPLRFARGQSFEKISCVKGKRPSSFICKKINLNSSDSESWFQIFDTWYDAKKLMNLKSLVKDRKVFEKDLKEDISLGIEKMTSFIAQADGIQNTAHEMTAAHHEANVMFNIMRGGIFQNSGKINISDFNAFAAERNKPVAEELKKITCLLEKDVTYTELSSEIEKSGNPHFMRLFCEYLPLTFSRRHGDPSRPWNRFSIILQDNFGNPVLNYEGNWRDIFQNWEALAWSYPSYIKNMTAKFLNAMTIDGFNPYHISRKGLNWEIPNPDDPWAQIGYWGDHQVIYLEKLLEFWNKTNHQELVSLLNTEIFSSSNVPYRIKKYSDLIKDPRNSIAFDRELSDRLMKETEVMGSDAKLVRGKDGLVTHVSLTAKLMQILIAKMANFIPGGGIWLNTQRPEWNDANNALAGWGLSMVTLYYIRRFTAFLIKIYSESAAEAFLLPEQLLKATVEIGKLFKESDAAKTASDPKKRASFNEKAQLIFETERNSLYENGYGNKVEIKKEDLLAVLFAFQKHTDHTISVNKRSDGLYHAYNTLRLSGDEMYVENLQEMLEGQVAVLSSGLLSDKEALELLTKLRNSAMYEPRQNSYMLYPNKELPHFEDKNCISGEDTKGLENLIERTSGLYLRQDILGVWHFNPDFRNEEAIGNIISAQEDKLKPTDEELELLMALYEKTFNHQSFTGRSGTFYAYEGLGSIYWHMNAKLLLAVQENALAATDEITKSELIKAYFEVRKGLGFNKTPDIWGAFPMDPYSHTPWKQGAKQPGMTGQVKEEVLTRWGELGICIEDGIAGFAPSMLLDEEFDQNGKLNFTWCGTSVEYVKNGKDEITVRMNGNSVTRKGTALTREESATLFARTGKIEQIVVNL